MTTATAVVISRSTRTLLNNVVLGGGRELVVVALAPVRGMAEPNSQLRGCELAALVG